MAWLQQDPSGNYHVGFRFGGSKFKRSLGTKRRRDAEGLIGRIEDNISLVERGVRVIPLGADVPTFLLSDGNLANPPRLVQAATLSELFAAFFTSLPDGSLEESTVDGMRIHRNHLVKHLGAAVRMESLGLEDLQRYVAERSHDQGLRGKKVSGATIKKEVVTLRSVWNWGIRTGRIKGPFPGKGVRYPKISEKPPFQTWEEIERQIARGGLSHADQAGLWDCVFLSLQQTTELLDFIKNSSGPPWLCPMVVMAAHTGARRSELLRSKLADLQEDTIVIQERKKARGKRTTRRVPISAPLRRALKEWLQEHPGGQYTFCQLRAGGPEPLTKDQAHVHLKHTLGGSKWEVLRGWHVLRHSFISNCALKGIDPRIIDSFVGHTTEEMRRRYTHLFPSAKRDAIDSVFG